MDLLPVIIVPLPKSNVEKEENGERREKGGRCEMKMRGIGTYHQPFLLIGGHILIALICYPTWKTDALLPPLPPPAPKSLSAPFLNSTNLHY